jgi:uncharacterized membrane protein
MESTMKRVLKTSSYGIIHLCVAVTVAYIITENWAAALGIGVIEPMIQTVVFALHDWAWEHSRHKHNLTLSAEG